MNNLSIEGLSNVIQPKEAGTSGAIQELKVDREMSNQGMQAGGGHGATFGELLRDSIEKVNETQQQADFAIKETIAGRNKNIHETMLAVEKADASLKLMMQVRNKILDAYREVMRMQV